MTKNVNVRFDDEMHARLVAAAKRNRRSLNAQVETYCDRGLNADDLAEYPPVPAGPEVREH